MKFKNTTNRFKKAV